MPLASLPADLQLIEIYNFGMFIRVFWIFLMVSFALIYVFYWRPYHQKKTPLVSIAMTQGFLYIFSIILLIASPFLFFGMSPESDAWLFIFPFFNLYLILLTIYVLLINIDLIRYGVPVVLKLGGINMDDPKAAQVYKKFFGKNGR